MTVALQLGQYWAEVALSYGLSALLLAFVTGLSLHEARRTHDKLRELEPSPDER